MVINSSVATRSYWQDSNYCARLADTFDDLNSIFRLRYQSYVVERKIPLVYADHFHKSLQEPLDDVSYQMTASDLSGQILATTRITFSRDYPENEIPYHPSYFQYRKIPFATSYALVTKLAVNSQYRGSALALGICKATIRFIYEQGAEVLFIDVGHFMVRFMTRLGFRAYVGEVDHPEFGPSIPMYLSLKDIDHLRRVNSPFAAIAEEYQTEELIHEA